MSEIVREIDHEVERLDPEKRQALERELAEVGPGWVYILGTGGIHRAERRGTRLHQQVSTTAEGLLAAVRRFEEKIERGDIRGTIQVK